MDQSTVLTFLFACLKLYVTMVISMNIKKKAEV